MLFLFKVYALLFLCFMVYNYIVNNLSISIIYRGNNNDL